MALPKKATMPLMAALAVAIGLVGGIGINSLNANAATTPATSNTAATADTTDTSSVETNDDRPGQPDQSKGGHVGSNGTKEALLTGDAATKAKEAALAAVPGGTIDRVENDAEGATYEAHATKADGTEVEVKMDSNFKVTSIDNHAR
jgi:hypothetical protein